MTKTIQTTLLALPLLCGIASAQLTGPEVLVEGAPVFTPVDIDATRSFEMRGTFPGTEAATELAQRLMVRGSGIGPVAPVTLTPSADGSKLMFIGQDDPSNVIEIDNTTGDISFCRGMKGLEVDGDTPNLPGRNAAVRAAIEHLEALNLLPENMNELTLNHVGGLRMAGQNEDGSSLDFAKLVTVHFGRQIDGLSVSGPGSKIIVQLGENAELVGLQRRWIEIEADAHDGAEFLNAAETVEAVTEHLATEWDRAMKIESERPQLGLFDDGQGRIEPAYFFLATLSYDAQIHDFAKDGSTSEYLGVVPALRTAQARFQQLAKKPAAVQGTAATSHIDPADDDEPSNR